MVADSEQVEERIIGRGRKFFRLMGLSGPSFFSRERWVGKVMDWTMRHEDFKTKVFKLIDTLPDLGTEEMLYRYIQESFLRTEHLGGLARAAVRTVGLLGKLDKKLLSWTVRKSVEMVAAQFIIGSKSEETVGTLGRLRRRDGYAFTLDELGENTAGEETVDGYVRSYLRVLADLDEAQASWKSLGPGDSQLDWGSAAKVNISIKPSALCRRTDLWGLADTVEHILGRLKGVYRRVVESGAFLCIDAETREYRDVTLEVYRRLRNDPEFRDYPNLGVAMQTYFKDSEEELDKILSWSRRESLPISIRLVKGAYWDHEVAIAEKADASIPVYGIKAEVDAAFERAAEKILENHDICHLACGSHNVRSVCSVMALGQGLNVPENRFEFQVLYGMAAQFPRSLLAMNGRVRLYCPHGPLLGGMAYLVRRLLENTSNESFLRRTFAEGPDVDRLLENPKVTLERIKGHHTDGNSHLVG